MATLLYLQYSRTRFIFTNFIHLFRYAPTFVQAMPVVHSSASATSMCTFVCSLSASQLLLLSRPNDLVKVSTLKVHAVPVSIKLSLEGHTNTCGGIADALTSWRNTRARSLLVTKQRGGSRGVKPFQLDEGSSSTLFPNAFPVADFAKMASHMPVGSDV